MGVKDTIKSKISPNYHTARLRMAAAVPSSRPLVAVYGNCQANALRRVLGASDSFSERYNTVQIPAVHEITRAQLPMVQRVISRASLFITQNIRDDYRDMPLGRSQMLAIMRSGARVVTFPSMFYNGLHPYLVYVHATGTLGTLAPLTYGYHDLRFIYAAAAGMPDKEASDWLAQYSGDSNFLRNTAANSFKELREREKELDVSVSEVIPELAAESFWTVNHPSNAVLRKAASHIHQLTGTGKARKPMPELLTAVVIPVHCDVRRALGYGMPATEQRWAVNGRSYDDQEVMKSHLAFYRSRPDVLEHARHEHSELLAAAGLGCATRR